MDTSKLSFLNLLLLERVQISWLSGWMPEDSVALALRANPAVEWYFRHKYPPSKDWLDKLPPVNEADLADREKVYQAEQAILQTLNDLLVYVVDPAVYERQPFLEWDSNELTGLVDFSNQIVLDIGAGTGRLAFVAAPVAKAVYCVEPVANLRDFILSKAHTLGHENVYAVDGLITRIPFHDGFADITMGGHVFGDFPEEERDELERVTRTGGMVILCPGNIDKDTPAHQSLLDGGYQFSRFYEPEDGWRRKYWKTKT